MTNEQRDPRPRPVAEDRLHVANRGVVDLHKDDVLVDGLGGGGEPHAPVVQLQLGRLEEPGRRDGEDDRGRARAEQETG